MKALLALLLFVMVALPLNTALADPPAQPPNDVWVNLTCGDESWDVRVPNRIAPAAQLPDGRIVLVRTIYVMEGDEWVMIWQKPGQGYETQFCSWVTPLGVPRAADVQFAQP